jgi:phosphoenolpyruvate-protein phosphotransferase (PTS system enzyme I)
MEQRKGIAASPGIAISQALILDSQQFPISHRKVTAKEIPEEKRRFLQAVADSISELQSIQQTAALQAAGEHLKVFDAHVSMLRDQTLQDEILREIETANCTAELAISVAIKRHARAFLANDFLKRLVYDLQDIEQALIRHLHGMKRDDLGHLKEHVIIVAQDLTPTQTVTLDKEKVVAFATDVGGRTAHTAILARALGIPAVVGLGSITAEVVGGDLLIVDGTTGTVIINPDAATLDSYHAKVRHIEEHEARLARLRRLPAETVDGKRVRLFANIESPDEAKMAVERGAEGIGLYRTEFLFFEKGGAPDEEEHYEAYRQVVEALGGRPVTIRTFDMGGDKLFPGKVAVERNPFLGCRSIRLCLQHPDLFKTQIRAILRASALGPASILFPMISNVREVRRAKAIVHEVMAELDEAGIPFRRTLEIGIMIEVPGAAKIIDLLAKEVDFVSIGTNDLVQYTLAVDRGNEHVSELFQPAHPAVLRLIRDVIEAGRASGIRVAMCGEMSGEVIYAVLLLGLGLTEFSVSPAVLPQIKEIIRSVTTEHAQEVARTALSFDEPERTVAYLREWTTEVLPEIA